MADPQALSWREAYRMITQETNKEKLGPLVMAAEAAIFRRFQELESSSDHYVEHAELKAATDELLVLKVNTLGWPAVR